MKRAIPLLFVFLLAACSADNESEKSVSETKEELTIELENHPERFTGDQDVILESLNDMATSSVTMDKNNEFFFDSNQYFDAKSRVEQYLNIE